MRGFKLLLLVLLKGTGGASPSVFFHPRHVRYQDMPLRAVEAMLRSLGGGVGPAV